MNTSISDRYRAMQDLGIDVEKDHLPAPESHAPPRNAVKQTENDLLVYEDENPENQILCEGGLLDVKR